MNRLLICVAVVACSKPDESHKAPVSTPPAVVTPDAVAKPVIDDRYDDGSLGAISFDLSEGKPEARAHFKRGLLALHSFWYDEATRQFQAAIDADPTMNMAYWGASMASCKLLWGDDDVVAAKKMLARMPDPDHVSPREQAWMIATVELLTDADVRSSRRRFLAAMEDLDKQFPDDESKTFLALALLSASRPEDPDAVAVRKRAAALALGVYQHNPKHPGAAHYLIHAYDTPELAQLALPYARDYAKIAPAAFHARHMPAHIFAQLGMWTEAIASCQSAWDASVAAAQREKLSADHDDFHSLDWLVEMNFELGKRKAADVAMTTFSTAVRGGLSHQQRGQYATRVASYMMRTGEWSRVDELLAPLEAPAIETTATTASGRTGAPASHCAPGATASPTALLEQLSVLDARSRAAAMQRDVPRTTALLAEIETVRANLRGFLTSTQPKEAVARIDEDRRRSGLALMAHARGDDRALLKILRESATDADRQTAGENNPSGFLVREEIADTLMRLDQAKAAVAEYTLALASHPNRAHSLLGLARAAKKTGDLASARARYGQLAELWSGADEGIDGLAEARAAK